MSQPLPIARGRRFTCVAGCAACCHRPGFVNMSRDEERTIARFLGLPVRELRERTGLVAERGTDVRFLEVREGHACPFLHPKKGCTVHPVKPIQCQTFPFWPELLDDRREWEASKDFCPGLDAPEGRRYPRTEILKILRENQGTG